MQIFFSLRLVYWTSSSFSRGGGYPSKFFVYTKIFWKKLDQLMEYGYLYEVITILLLRLKLQFLYIVLFKEKG